MSNPHYVCGGGRHEEKTAIKHRGVYSIPLIKTTTNRKGFLAFGPHGDGQLIPLNGAQTRPRHPEPESTNDETATPGGQISDYNAKTGTNALNIFYIF